MDKLLPLTRIKSHQSNASKTKCQYTCEYFKREALIVIMWKICMCVRCVHVYVCRRQRSTSGFLLYCSSVFETVSAAGAYPFGCASWPAALQAEPVSTPLLALGFTVILASMWVLKVWTLFLLLASKSPQL